MGKWDYTILEEIDEQELREELWLVMGRSEQRSRLDCVKTGCRSVVPVLPCAM